MTLISFAAYALDSTKRARVSTVSPETDKVSDFAFHFIIKPKISNPSEPTAALSRITKSTAGMKWIARRLLLVSSQKCRVI